MLRCDRHGDMPGSYCFLCAGEVQAEDDKRGRKRFPTKKSRRPVLDEAHEADNDKLEPGDLE